MLLSFTICNIWVCVYLQRSHPELLTTPALSYLRQVVDEPLKDVGGIQVTVVVHVDVDHALGIWGGRRNVLYIIFLRYKRVITRWRHQWVQWVDLQHFSNSTTPESLQGCTRTKDDTLACLSACFLNVMGHLFIGYCYWLSQQELVIFDQATAWSS